MRARSGYALMLVLWLIVVMGTITTAAVASAGGASDVTANYRARLAARHAAESGVLAAVAVVEQALGATGTPAVLNRLDGVLAEHAALVLGDARAAVSLVDVNARIDLNFADERTLATLLATLTDGPAAVAAAGAMRRAAPFSAVEELADVAGVAPVLAGLAAPLVTVDGDGTINRASAPAAVLAAARGELRDAPTRLLIVSRGWREGHPFTFEVQAVYAIEGLRLVPVRRRERDL
jgi:general secretion pathway protein K